MDILKLSKTKIINLYSIFIAFLPFVAIYASGISGFNAGDIILILFFAFAILDNLKRKENFNKSVNGFFILFLVHVLLSYCINVLIDSDLQIVEIGIRIIKLGFYTFSVLFTSKRYLNFEVTKKWIVNLTIIATTYLFIQYFFYFKLGIILKGYISWLPIYETNYLEVNYELAYSIFFRPTSLFLEPAWYCQYSIVGLAILLMETSFNRIQKAIISVFISLGIIMSTSMQGLILAVIVWLFWGLKTIKTGINKKKLYVFLVLILILPIILMKVYNLEIIQKTLARINGGTSNSQSAVSARFGGFSSLNNLNLLELILGKGYGNVPENVWMSSMAYIMYGTGIIGTVVIFLLFLSIYSKNNSPDARTILIIYFCTLFGASIFYNYMFVFYFSIILYSNKELETRSCLE